MQNARKDQLSHWYICPYCSGQVMAPQFGLSWCDPCKRSAQPLVTDGAHVYRSEQSDRNDTTGREPHGN